MYDFTSKLNRFPKSTLWAFHFNIPKEIANELIEGKDRRVLCQINGSIEFQCAIMRATGDQFFINVNKEIRTKLQIKEGDELNIILKKDHSEFGLPFPIELRETLLSDEKAQKYFEALSPGRKRNLLYIVSKFKSIDKRIEKSLVIAAHLKKQNGKIDFKQLNEDFRQALL